MGSTTKLYENFQHILLYWCKRFHKKYGGNIDDIVSEANLIFTMYAPRYDKGYGTNFEQYMIYFLKKRIEYPYRRQRRRDKIARQHILTKAAKQQLIEIESKFDWVEWAKQLTNEAAEVVKAVVEIPNELRRYLMGERDKAVSDECNFRRGLRKYLKKRGWNQWEIIYAFREIKETL